MKQLSRADAALLSDLRQADEKLGRLPEAMLEKDVFITEATLALSQLSSPEIGMVFWQVGIAGGLIPRSFAIYTMSINSRNLASRISTLWHGSRAQ